jgi:GTPase SAR1 family protein
MKVQIIGLPCSGKTTIIKKYLSKNLDIDYIDIRSFNEPNKNFKYVKKIRKSTSLLIAESACGVSIPGTEVVRLDIPKKELFTRMLDRDNQLDEDYLSLLETQMIPAKFTVRSESALIGLLNNIFYGK